MTLRLTVPDVHRIVLHDRQEQEASSDDKQRLVNVWRRRYYKFSWRPELWEENVILFLLENSREKGKQGPRFEASGSSVTGSRRFPEKIPSNAPVQIHCLFPFSFLGTADWVRPTPGSPGPAERIFYSTPGFHGDGGISISVNLDLWLGFGF